MEIGNLTKWVDELAGTVDSIKKRVAAVASSVPKISVEIDTPTAGQTLLYDAEDEAFKNADVPSSGDSNIFSTTETVIGTWIDGRPIYRVVIDKSDSPLVSNSTVDVTDLNIDILVRADALGTDTNGSYSGARWNLGSVSGNANRIMYLDTNSLKINGDYYKYWLILEYVKPAPEPEPDENNRSAKKTTKKK